MFSPILGVNKKKNILCSPETADTDKEFLSTFYMPVFKNLILLNLYLAGLKKLPVFNPCPAE